MEKRGEEKKFPQRISRRVGFKGINDGPPVFDRAEANVLAECRAIFLHKKCVHLKARVPYFWYEITYKVSERQTDRQTDRERERERERERGKSRTKEGGKAS